MTLDRDLTAEARRRRARAPAAACLALGLFACENRVSSTRQCLGDGSRTSTYERYTFEIDEGPALEVAGNCRVILIDCTIRAPEGIRASESAVVEMRGGSLTATRGPAVTASGRARVSFVAAAVTGAVRRAESAQVTGLPSAR
jgi:hypothetical protein